ncbi:MAG: maturase [Propionibacteriales bacterium]|nr:maturase [Propionibacteriales bacterium]
MVSAAHRRRLVNGSSRRRVSRSAPAWWIHRWTELTLDELATWLNPRVAGWMQYYGKFRPSELQRTLRRINTYLMRWARRKYKRIRSFKRFQRWWKSVLQRAPRLFAHWAWATDLDGLR